MQKKTISLDEMDGFQIDEANRLYWKGEEIVTLTKITLPWWGNVCVIIAAIATMGSFILQGLGAANLLPSSPKQQIELIVKYPEQPPAKSP